LMHCGTLIYQVSVGNALKAADLQTLKEIKNEKKNNRKYWSSYV